MIKFKEFIIRYKGYIICLLIVILSIVSIIMQDIDRKNTLKVNNNDINKEDNKIGVYITGAVKNPGVYYLDENSRIYNLLDICGGVEENADISKLNLAQKLVDSDKIEVPIKIEENLNSVEDYIDEEVINDKVNINTATLEELKTLNGIGDSTAQKIIEYRKNYRFEQIEDIMNVSGIGENKFENIKDYICVK